MRTSKFNLLQIEKKIPDNWAMLNILTVATVLARPDQPHAYFLNWKLLIPFLQATHI